MRFTFLFFLRFYFIFGEEGREKEWERNTDLLPLACLQLGTWPATKACALMGNGMGDLSVRRPALNPLSHTSQD